VRTLHDVARGVVHRRVNTVIFPIHSSFAPPDGRPTRRAAVALAETYQRSAVL